MNLASHTLISESGGRRHGSVTFITVDRAGHVRDLTLAPGAPERYGRELMHAVAGALRARGIVEWFSTVAASDLSTVRLHEDLGMTIEQRSTVLRVPVARLAELPESPGPATVLEVDPLEDDDIERALGLLAGRIAMLRLKSRVLLHVRDRDLAPVGFAACTPVIPGAMPFRVARPEWAGALLAAIARHTSQPEMQIVVEDDPRTVALLATIGGAPELQLLHFRGSLVTAC